jgi:hypothetical protein
VQLSKENVQSLVGLHADVIQYGSTVMVVVEHTVDNVGSRCAKWLCSRLVKESPPDPEDEEDTKLGPEEVTADAEGGWKLKEWNSLYNRCVPESMTSSEIVVAILYLRKNKYPRPEDCLMFECPAFKPTCSAGICKIAIDMCGDS